jgi:tRNA/rRNA methyltransferase/tRNA (cytidine32/uridine32-2'-O)-methyltransferase
MDQEAIRALAVSISGSLADLGFYKQPGREEQERYFQDIFSRAGLTPRDGEYMARIFAKAARLGVQAQGKPLSGE